MRDFSKVQTASMIRTRYGGKPAARKHFAI
jgi:hypothetical protein